MCFKNYSRKNFKTLQDFRELNFFNLPGFNSPINGSSLDCLSLIVQSISSPDVSSCSPQNSPNPSAINHLQQQLNQSNMHHLNSAQHFKCEFEAKVNWKQNTKKSGKWKCVKSRTRKIMIFHLNKLVKLLVLIQTFILRIEEEKK